MSNIIRVKKIDHPFVQMDKRAIQDENLSWKAKGLLCYLLSMPDDWQFYINELKNHATDGRDSTRSGFNELIESGYITKSRNHSEDGTFDGFDYIVYELPFMASQSIYGLSENGLSENGLPENGESNTTNKESTNKNLTNNVKKRGSSRTHENSKDPEKLRTEEQPTTVQAHSKRDNMEAAENSPSLIQRWKAAQTIEELVDLWIYYRRAVIDKPLGKDAQTIVFDKMKEWGPELTRQSMLTAFANEYEGLKPYAKNSF